MQKALTTEVANLKTQIAGFAAVSRQPNTLRDHPKLALPSHSNFSGGSYKPSSEYASSNIPVSAGSVPSGSPVSLDPGRQRSHDLWMEARGAGSIRSPRVQARSPITGSRDSSASRQRSAYKNKRGVPRCTAADEAHERGWTGCTYTVPDKISIDWTSTKE